MSEHRRTAPGGDWGDFVARFLGGYFGDGYVGWWRTWVHIEAFLIEGLDSCLLACHLVSLLVGLYLSNAGTRVGTVLVVYLAYY